MLKLLLLLFCYKLMQVLWEITAGQLGKAPDAVTDSLPVPEAIASTADDEEDLEEMQSRLQALKS